MKESTCTHGYTSPEDCERCQDLAEELMNAVHERRPENIERQLREIAKRFATEATYRIGDGWSRQIPLRTGDNVLDVKFTELHRYLAVALVETGQFEFAICLKEPRENLTVEHIALVLFDLWDAYCAAYGRLEERTGKEP